MIDGIVVLGGGYGLYVMLFVVCWLIFYVIVVVIVVDDGGLLGWLCSEFDVVLLGDL